MNTVNGWTGLCHSLRKLTLSRVSRHLSGSTTISRTTISQHLSASRLNPDNPSTVPYHRHQFIESHAAVTNRNKISRADFICKHNRVVSPLTSDGHILDFTSTELTENLAYVCPGAFQSQLIHGTVLDPNTEKFVDCPELARLEISDAPSVKHEITEPPSVSGVVEIHAKNVLRYRRRGMNRHKLKKLRKRMRFKFRTIRQRRSKKKEKIFQALLDAKIKVGTDFDAREFVLDRLDKAKSGGYFVDIRVKKTLKQSE